MLSWLFLSNLPVNNFLHHMYLSTTKFCLNKMVVSKHLTHFCYPIRLVLHQHLNSHIAYPGIPPDNSNHIRGVNSDADEALA